MKKAASRKLAAPRKRGLIKPHKQHGYYVEYQEAGKHVDSATYPTRAECEHWLITLYNVEADNGTV
jgi:hypothetical protein